MNALLPILAMFSVLTPSKLWYAPSQPIEIAVKGEGQFTLVLTTFTGKKIDPEAAADVAGGKSIDLRTVWPKALTQDETYILYAVPAGQSLEKFAGTPLVIENRTDRRPGVPPQGILVTRVEPLRYAVMTTDKGPLTMAFYFDVAPATADNFLSLAASGYYDGLAFHRIVPGFVIQGGDPLGTGNGGPGYQITAEFNDRKHEEGVLSMARLGDEQERGGAMPRAEYANSAGSQFFICLDYRNTKALDRRYTAFGKVVDGMDAVKAIAAAPIANPETGRPKDAQPVRKVEVLPVTNDKNPYAKLFAAPPAEGK